MKNKLVIQRMKTVAKGLHYYKVGNRFTIQYGDHAVTGQRFKMKL